MTTITERSTKKDIWEAYQLLKQEAGGETVSLKTPEAKSKEVASDKDNALITSLRTLEDLKLSVDELLEKFMRDA